MIDFCFTHTYIDIDFRVSTYKPNKYALNTVNIVKIVFLIDFYLFGLSVKLLFFLHKKSFNRLFGFYYALFLYSAEKNYIE